MEEAEWERAATVPVEDRATRRRPFPWGSDAPSAQTAHLDQNAKCTVPVTAKAAGDSPYGCRQMIGNAWEWTSSIFRPYPGFVTDPYKEYSEPWFETRRVLRGGSFASRGRMLRNTWRNFALPERRDLWTGFRTCALGG